MQMVMRILYRLAVGDKNRSYQFLEKEETKILERICEEKAVLYLIRKEHFYSEISPHEFQRELEEVTGKDLILTLIFDSQP